MTLALFHFAPPDRRATWLAVFLMTALLAACGTDSDQKDATGDGPAIAMPVAGVDLDSDAQDNLGIEVQSLAAATYREVREGPARVLNPLPVVQALSALDSAQATAASSDAALERAEKLFNADTAGSLETLENARQQAAAARADLEVARSRLVAGYGSAAPWREEAAVNDALAALVAGRAVLVQAGFPDGLPGGIPDGLNLRRIGATAGEGQWSSASTWAGPADPAVPGPVVLAWLEGDGQDLFSGERLTAFFPRGEALSGTTVPRDAIVYAGGAAWCYLFQAPDRFDRRQVDVSRPNADGYFQAADFTPGEQVVVRGAGLLLASETAGSGGGD